MAALIRLDVDGAYGSTGFAGRLAAVAETIDRPDSYGEGEVVAGCEAALARALGKERAILFPTGTLANLVALDRLCGRFARRVLVHPDSHVHNDCGDALAALFGLTAIAAAPEGAGFGPDALLAALERARSGKVAQTVGAVVIETPVRRQRNAMVPPALLAEVVAAARAAGVGLHLDGARLPIAAAAEGRSMAAFASGFDTVYLSLWKMFGLPFGAVLAGPAALLDGADHDRRRFGGGIPQFWPIAAVVSAELERLEPGWAETFGWLARLKGRLAGGSGLAVEPVGAAATNTIWLRPASGDAHGFRARCRGRGIALGDAEGGRVLLRANPTVLGQPAEHVAATLLESA